MSYLLDTCVVSEFVRRSPNKRVIDWIDAQPEELLFISVITIGEIRRGIERLPESTRKTDLQKWFEARFIPRFDCRILPIETETMQLWGAHCAKMEKSGRPLPVIYSLLIATAIQHHLVVVTRNIADFLPGGVQVINPWQE